MIQNSLLRVIFLILLICGCRQIPEQPISIGIGSQPTLPEPQQTFIPTINIASAKGWPRNTKPQAAEGMQVDAFSNGLDHPRWLYVLPNGDVLVAETNAPPQFKNNGIKAWIKKIGMEKTGASTASANRITLLRDKNNDGIADLRSTFLDGLNSPFGMVLVDNILYIANSDAVLKFPYTKNDTRISATGVKVTDLPAGTINHHWTKNIIASEDGEKLYVTVGSNSNVAEHGMDEEYERAAILEVDIKTGAHRIFASGLRNPNGMAWEPHSGVLWTVVNERDDLGDNLVPDYMTSVHEGNFFGWPYSYYGQHIDERVKPQRPDLVAKAIAPDYALGSHTGSLGLASSVGTTLPATFANGMFIGQHGSWNRRSFSGYKVIFVPFINGKPSTNTPIDVLTGFLSAEGDAFGRPVGVALDKQGALLVADDVGNTIWRISSPPRE